MSSLLPYPTEPKQRIVSRLAAQIVKIEDITAGHGHGSIRTSTATAAHSRTGSGNQNLNFLLSILQTDVGLTQFIVRSLLRSGWRRSRSTWPSTSTQSQADESKKLDLLSESEAQFLRNHQALLARFYGATFLNTFPAGLRKLDDRSWGVSIVEGPEGANSVFVRCLEEKWKDEEEDEEVEGGGLS